METGHIPHSSKSQQEEVKEKVRAGAANLAERAVDAGSSALQHASDTASSMGQKAQEAARNVGQHVQEAASRTVDKADQAIAGVGQKMSSAADSLRQSAPRAGMMGSAAETVAGNLDAGGRYLQEHGLEDMVEDFSSVIRRHPLTSLFLALGTGVMLGAVLRRR